MGRPLRYIPPGEMVEVTNRTFQGRFLLRPTREMRSCIIGALGRSQRRFSMPIHAFTFASNHFHLLLKPRDAKHLADFMAYFEAKLAHEVQRLHDWSGSVWADRYHSIPVEANEPTQVQRLAYVLSHGVKEDLVARVSDWPGANCVLALVEGRCLRGIWVDRAALYKASRWGRQLDLDAFSQEEEVSLSPLPCWAHLPESEVRQRVRSMIAAVESEARARHRATGTRPLGPRAILSHRPSDRPENPKHSPQPWFHARSKDGRRRMREAYRLFVLAFRRAATALSQGDSRPAFPQGSFPPGLPFVYHRAPG